MTTERHEHAPIVEAWLKEPVWLPEGDTARIAQLVHQTPQQRGWLRPIISRRTHDMFTATKFVTAGVIIAVASGFLLFGSGMLPQANETLPAASAVASATPDGTAAADSSAAPEVSVEAAPDGALVMATPDPGLSAGGWTQVGSAPYTNPDGSGFGELHKLQSFGGDLVALGSSSVDVDAEQSRDVVFRSADGQTWLPVSLPGNDPVLNDMATTADGLIVAGMDRVDGERVARLWSSADATTWGELPAPEGAAEITQIVSAQDPLAVRANERLWLLEEDGTWTDLGRNPNSQILRGPSGYITWQGGGQDRRFQLTMTHQAQLGGEIREIGLPGRLGRGKYAEIGVQLFDIGDRWVMVPEGTETPIYVSSDGFDWQEVPRPDRMLGDYVAWMEMVGDELQAFGIQYRQNGSPSGFWTIDLGSTEPAAFEMLDRDANHHLGAPVAFEDGEFATGIYNGRDSGLTSWRRASE